MEMASDALSPQGEGLGELYALADELSETVAAIEETEELLSQLKVQRERILKRELPEMMAQQGMGQGDSIQRGPMKLTLSRYVSGTWPKEPERQEQAIAVLREHDALGLLKTTVAADFGKGEWEKAQQAFAALQETCEPSLKQGVHPQTLAKFVREVLDAGEDIDFTKLNVSSETMVRITKTRKRT